MVAIHKSTQKKPLPDIRYHFRFFLAGVLGSLLLFLAEWKFPDLPTPLVFLLAIPSWLAIVVPLLGYLVVYPFLHLMGRFEGRSRQAWLFWLVIDTFGITFGIVRVCYFLSEILPDFAHQRRIPSRPTTE